MANIGFRWLDILEKEFDKAFVDLDVALGGEFDNNDAVILSNARKKLCSLGSCFAQLSHKAQTIFQNSAKLEAELIHMRAELIESKAKKELLENELHNLLLQLHSSQLSKLPDSLGNKKLDALFKPDVNAIKRRLEAEIQQSPIRIRRSMSTTTNNSKDASELKCNPNLLDPIRIKMENAQLHTENAALRNDVLALTAEVYGAKLAAKYLDKELAGRIQQLQLLGKEMRGEIRDKLWCQLESEILLQRHKTVVRACRRNSSLNVNNTDNNNKCPTKPQCSSNNGTSHFGDIRVVVVKRKPDQGLGISITGGREHGVPILISELEPNGPAAQSQQLYIGDAILYVNDLDLRNACHKEAVTILQQQTGDCVLQVQYISADDSDNSLEEDGFSFRFFNDEVCESRASNHHIKDSQEEIIINTPTAPRTPESINSISRMSHSSRTNSANTENGISPYESAVIIKKCKETTNNNNNNNNNTANNTLLPDNITKFSSDLENVDTSELVLLDNATNNIIKLENFKKVDVFATIDTMESNYNNCCSSVNSLISDNLSSPMQTSTDIYVDSEILSTDIASNDSHSPKNLQNSTIKKPEIEFNYDNINMLNKYLSIESLTNVKSDQSLINSDENESDDGSSPVHNKQNNRHVQKKQKKPRKKYFGVKTLQNIFSNKHEGYSDISTTGSELGDGPALINQNNNSSAAAGAGKLVNVPAPSTQQQILNEKTLKTSQKKVVANLDTSPQFEEHVHNIISDILTRSHIKPNLAPTKKYFSLHGQNLRVSKALRLCPNEDLTDTVDLEQRKEKLLARYVYNANSLNVDGVGDPDFGTPV